MSPPTIPSPNSPASTEVANIIIGALRENGYDAGISDRSKANQWKDFDLVLLWNNISIGSKRRNRSYLQVKWNKRIITFSIYGRRWGSANHIDQRDFPDQPFEVDLADPDSLRKIVDFISKTAIEDKYQYPFI